MKRTVLLAMLPAAALFLGIANPDTLMAAAAGAPGEDSGQRQNLRGTCIWQELKVATTSGDQQGAGPAAVLASINFDGRGGISMDYDANVDGAYGSTNGVPGTYTVDATGHGSFTFTSPASGYVRTYDFRVSSNGRTLYTMSLSDGTGSVAQRVSVGTCTF